jgi:hypothetical protein
MDSYLPASGIRFNDCLFSEPTRLSSWTQPKCACLFVVLVNDMNWAPRPMQPLCFGEFGNNSPVDALLRDYNRLLAAAGGKTLMVSVFLMPFSTTTQRWALRNELVWAYNPPCQTDGSASAGELARKVDELEKKNQEQTAQVTLLLASINKPAESRPDPARRRIGFLPSSPSPQAQPGY